MKFKSKMLGEMEEWYKTVEQTAEYSDRQSVINSLCKRKRKWTQPSQNNTDLIRDFDSKYRFLRPLIFWVPYQLKKQENTGN